MNSLNWVIVWGMLKNDVLFRVFLLFSDLIMVKLVVWACSCCVIFSSSF